MKKQKIVLIVLIAIILLGSIGGLGYWLYIQKRIYTDKAEIDAPYIEISSKSGGQLEKLMVKPGDQISENTILAQVGNQIITNDQAGLVVSVRDNIGKIFSPGESIITMVYPNELRVIGHIDEDKGLEKLKVGQRVIFTVDSQGAKKYFGVVDEISEVSNASSVVFNISDKRAIKQFDVKIRFNINQYPELKDGMSAKLWIYIK